MTATATHDTKRGEDARARLLALSEMPEAWAAAVERFDALTEPLLVDLDEVRGAGRERPLPAAAVAARRLAE